MSNKIQKTSGLPQVMIDAVYCNAEIDSGMLDEYTSYSGISNAEEIAQGVINAAWTKFDINNQQTWPEKDGTYFVEENDTEGFQKKSFVITSPKNVYCWSAVTYWANPDSFNRSIS